MEADVGDVVAAAAAGDAPNVGGVPGGVERAADGRPGFGQADAVPGGAQRSQMVEVLRRRQQLEELDGTRVPAGHVARELLEHRRGPLSPAVGDRVRDLGARAADHLGQAVQRAVAEQVADVRRHPLRAGLDELVVVELLEVLLEDRDLAGDDVEQLAQLVLRTAGALRVADAIDRRQELVQPLRRRSS